MPAHFPVAAITDEFSADLETAVRSMRELGMTGAELRMIDGRNIVDLSDEQLDRAIAIVGDAGLEIVSIASPLLKCVLPDSPEVDARFQQDMFASKNTFADQPRLTARTFEIAAELVRAGGLDVGQLSQRLYENYPRRRLELLRELLRTMRFTEGGRAATFSLGLKTAAELGVLPEDNEGLIDHLRAIRGVIVAVFFEELADGKVRVSMRSKSDAVDVCAICQKFGGGGHTAAAGARVRGTLAEVEEKVLEEIGDVLKSHS